MLAARPDDGPAWKTLEGETSRGLRLKLEHLDGTMTGLWTTASVYCPRDKTWRPVRWNFEGARSLFRQDDSGFRLNWRERQPESKEQRPQVLVLRLRGRLSDDRDSASGTMYSRWVWDGYFVCEGTVRFSAG